MSKNWWNMGKMYSKINKVGKECSRTKTIGSNSQYQRLKKWDRATDPQTFKDIREWYETFMWIWDTELTKPIQKETDNRSSHIVIREI